jgi:hypothetical protein
MGLYWQGITHDLSKYSPTEFINGVKFFTGKASPHYGERASYGYSKAWLHHKGRNKHHAEYWADIQPNGQTEPIPMPTRYLVEMMCDRIAASQTYLKKEYTDDAPLNYYTTHRDENKFHDDTRGKLEVYLSVLSTFGLDSLIITVKEDMRKENKNVR